MRKSVFVIPKTTKSLENWGWIESSRYCQATSSGFLFTAAWHRSDGNHICLPQRPNLSLCFWKGTLNNPRSASRAGKGGQGGRETLLAPKGQRNPQELKPGELTFTTRARGPHAQDSKLLSNHASSPRWRRGREPRGRKHLGGG